MNKTLDVFLDRAHAVMQGPPLDPPGPPFRRTPTLQVVRRAEYGLDVEPAALPEPFRGTGPPPRVHVGVDLGTAYTVLAVLDENRQPLAGAYQFAQVVRDGLVVDFNGAITLLQDLKRRVEARLGFELISAATTFPPGVPPNEVRATQHVVRAAGFDCEQAVDEPTAANAVLQVKDGAVVDVGGGTTGVAVLRNGEVVATADEATGGTHFTLVIAGALGMAFEEAEDYKKIAAHHQRLYPIVRPVMEKVGTIVARHTAAHKVKKIYLVGGTACFSGIDKVVEEVTGIPTVVPGYPLFVTPLGAAMYNLPESDEVSYGR